MSKQDLVFQQRLLATFKIEAEEHVQAISSSLIALEKAGPAAEQSRLLEIASREAHSLKGAARAVNLTGIERACQALESMFASLRRQPNSPAPGQLQLLLRTIDAISEELAQPKGLDTGVLPQLAREVAALASQAGNLRLHPDTAPGGPAGPVDSSLAVPERLLLQWPPSAAVPEEKAEVAAPPLPVAGLAASEDEPVPAPASEGLGRTGLAQTVRIPTERLDAILLQSEEMLSAKLSAQQRALDLREIGELLDGWGKAWTAAAVDAKSCLAAGHSSQHQVAGEPPASLLKLAEFFSGREQNLRGIQTRLADLTSTVEQDYRSLGRMLDNLLEDIKAVLMLPFSLLLEAFPKMIRDIARDQGKDIELVIQGGEVEIDRRILAGIKDALLHLVRNGIDHGLEQPAERVRQAKSPKGTLIISISQLSGGKVEILVADDGAGVDIEKVKANAIEQGLMTAVEAGELDTAAALDLLFRSGFSTSSIITDLSGRGLGLAIVREKVGEYGGQVTVESSSGLGTTFRMQLPVTVATFRGVVVEANGQQFVIPTTSIERVVRVNRCEVATVENCETISHDGKILALVRLADVLELPFLDADERPCPAFPALILAGGGERIAFAVNRVLNEQEVLVKGMGKYLRRVRNVAAATVFGSGQIALILNVTDLLRSARRTGKTARRLAEPSAPTKPQASILVVEDSVTSRMLLRGILESAGYRVTTAVDGAEGYAQLRAQPFDLVISDVQMPQMDGFQLTAKIRQDQQLAHLPVVLVTSLGSREDRERGIDAGANAYIVKSNFDQNSLLEVLQSLI